MLLFCLLPRLTQQKQKKKTSFFVPTYRHQRFQKLILYLFNFFVVFTIYYCKLIFLLQLLLLCRFLVFILFYIYIFLLLLFIPKRKKGENNKNKTTIKKYFLKKVQRNILGIEKS